MLIACLPPSAQGQRSQTLAHTRDIEQKHNPWSYRLASQQDSPPYLPLSQRFDGLESQREGIKNHPVLGGPQLESIGAASCRRTKKTATWPAGIDRNHKCLKGGSVIVKTL